MDVLKDIIDRVKTGGILQCSILTPSTQIPELFEGKDSTSFIVNKLTSEKQISIGTDSVFLENRELLALVYSKTYEIADSQIKIIRNSLNVNEGPGGKTGFLLPRINEYCYISTSGIIQTNPNENIQKAYSIKCLMGFSIYLEFFHKI